MPITWGSSPEIPNTISGYDIVQFTKYFAGLGMDFGITYSVGKWSVSAWNSADDLMVVSSGYRDTLEDALLGCYLEVRGSSAPPF